MKLKLQDYSSISDIIGAIAIVSSLIFVGLQINQNSIAAKANTRIALAEIARDNIKVNMDPRLISAKLKLFNGEKLTDAELLLMRMQFELIFRTAENVYFQYSVGTFNQEEFNGYDRFFYSFFTDPMVMTTWSERKSGYSSEFRKYIEELSSK